MKITDLKPGDEFLIKGCADSTMWKIGPTGKLFGLIFGDRCDYFLPCSSYINTEVKLLNRKMNIIEALTAMKNGKKVRQIDWRKGSFISLKDGQLYGNYGFYIYNKLSSLEEGRWEEYLPKTEISLNNEYTAVVTTEGVEVGCQKFSFDKIEELYQAVQTVKENK